jgi:hypothetical protein
MLARTFKRPDVDQFLSELEPWQFDEWIAFYRLRPWGPDRDDLRSGLLACAIDLAMNGESRWEPEDFLQRFEGDAGERAAAESRAESGRGRQSPEFQAELLREIAARFRG